MQYVKVCKSGRFQTSECMSFISSPASLVEVLNEEKSSLLKLVELLKQTLTVVDANFIYAAIYSFSSRDEFKLKL